MKRILVDIDGTICSATNGKYEEAKPYQNMIVLINDFYDNGGYVIIQSARGYGRFNGNTGLINKQWYTFTQNQLRDWGVKYHELHLNKIEADVFIDDKGFRVNDDGTSVEDLRKFLNE